MTSEHADIYLSLAAEVWWRKTADGTVVTQGNVTGSLGCTPDMLDSVDAWMKLVHSSDRGMMKSMLRESERGKRVSERIRIANAATGEYMKVMVHLKGVDCDGDMVIYAVHQSLRDLLAIEKESLSRQEDLAQVASTLSHDFRAPARHMSGCADRIQEHVDMLEDHVVKDERDKALEHLPVLRKWAAHASASGDRMGNMIEHVLQFSRAGSTKLSPEHVQTEDLVSEFIRYNADRDDKKRVVVKSMPCVFYDRTVLFMVMSNLIGNALKFSRIPGEDPRPVEVTGGDGDPGTVTISIRDYGVGIAKEHQRDIFDMGFRTHHERDYPGFGYGLAIVRRILVRCGGDITFRSKLGEGTEFILILPAGMPS